MTAIPLGAGLVLLVAGAEVLVRGAVRAASSLGASPLIIGLTVVALGTSSPELAVSVMSAAKGQADIALGNVVGSNIFNILCVLRLTAVVAPEGRPFTPGNPGSFSRFNKIRKTRTQRHIHSDFPKFSVFRHRHGPCAPAESPPRLAFAGSTRRPAIPWRMPPAHITATRVPGVGPDRPLPACRRLTRPGQTQRVKPRLTPERIEKIEQ